MILLDTHAWIWWTTRQRDQFPGTALRRLSEQTEQLAVASISCLEIAILVQKGRLGIENNDLAKWFELATDGAGIVLLQLTPAIAARVARLPDIHRDPVDRTIIATAMEHHAALVTKDATTRSYPALRTIWD